MKPEKPITRKEMYLDVATGGSTELPSPVTLEEKYLAKIAGMTVDLPAPVPLKHKFLAKIAGMQIDVPTYTTSLPRIYAYLAKAAGQDVEIPQPVTREEMYWFDYCGGTPTPPEREYTGAVPVTFIADGTPLIDYLISGNTVQSGTPTPDSPITPQGTGDLETVGVKAGQYKIPISSANTTTPVYLGEVETTRRIKKLVLTGQESWSISGSGDAARFYINLADAIGSSNLYCTHFAEGVQTTSGNCEITASKNLAFNNSGIATKTQNWKAWLQDEYAAGTPVTIWYVLAEPETGIVNEPLMRIGDYADTLSMEQAGAQIPTANGSTTLDVETAIKPSEVYIKYRGEAVATLSALPAEVSSPEAATEEENPEETEETENER
jgi:hypothetical protein